MYHFMIMNEAMLLQFQFQYQFFCLCSMVLLVAVMNYKQDTSVTTNGKTFIPSFVKVGYLFRESNSEDSLRPIHVQSGDTLI
jgi:hypothetical protein